MAKRDDLTCSKHLVIPQEKMQQISYFSHALCSAAVAFVAIHPHEARCIGRMCENSSTCPAGTAGSSLKDQLQPARRVGNSSIGAAKRLKCSTWSLSTQFYPTKCKTLWLSYIIFSFVGAVAAALIFPVQLSPGSRKHMHSLPSRATGENSTSMREAKLSG